MASVALGVAGTVALGPVGGAIGAIVGGLLDNHLIFPAIFGEDAEAQPDIPELELQTASEGGDVNRCFGPECRVAGTVIWQGEGETITVRSGRSGKGGGGGGTTERPVERQWLQASFAVLVCEGTIAGIDKIWFDGTLVHDASNNIVTSEIFTGTQTSPSSTIEGEEGVGNVPAYVGLSYVVFQNIDLTEYGNRVPNVELQVRAHPFGYRAADMIGDLIDETELGSDDWDVSGVADTADEDVHGFAVSGPTTVAKILEMVLRRFSLGARESNGRLEFFSHGTEPTMPVAQMHLGAREGEGPAGDDELIEFAELDPRDFPSEVDVQYIDAQKDLQPGSQREQLPHVPHINVHSIDMPFTMTAGHARGIARRSLYRKHSERHTVKFDLPPSYAALEEGDIARITYEGQDYHVRVTRILRAALSHRLECEGMVQATATEGVEPDAPPWLDIGLVEGEAPGGMDPQEVQVPPELVLEVLDIPGLTAQDTGHQPRVLFGVAAENPSDTFTGASVWNKHPQTPNYGGAVGVPVASTMGTALTVLDEPVNVDMWDRVNTVEVELVNGELESRDPDEVLRAQNWAILGDEIIAFKTATLIGTGSAGELQYRLSGLLRGRRDTRLAVDDHAVGERFVLLEDGVITHREHAITNVGTPREYRAEHDNGGNPTTPVGITLRANNILPFGPQLTGQEDTIISGAIYEWKRRTRILRSVFLHGAPLDEQVEEYEIDFFNAGNDALIETQRTTNTFAAIGAANTYAIVYQLSDFGFRGRPSNRFDVP